MNIQELKAKAKAVALRTNAARRSKYARMKAAKFSAGEARLMTTCSEQQVRALILDKQLKEQEAKKCQS